MIKIIIANCCALCLIFVMCMGGAGANTNYAVVIGIDDYSTAGFPALSNAENDALRVSAHFRSQGFQVIEIIGSKNNANKKELDTEIANLGQRIESSDTVVFFFAGHGHTELKNDIKLGYFVMLPDGSGADRNLISSGDIFRYSDSLDAARHQLFIFDFCYSGLLGRLPTRGASPVGVLPEDNLKDALFSRKARQYLSAGGDEQQVLDTGPAGLSWFTYFLLKGLEPGVVNSRDSGLVIFTELAAYVKVNSANRYHTPSGGSMLGHEGGDYLLYNTSHSRPPTEPLPQFDRQTLTDLGFITRGEPEKIRHTLEDMQRPIDLLYSAWQKRDVELYLAQLHPDIEQTYQKKSGERVSRRYSEIEAKRRQQFPRLEQVDVINYEVMYQGGNEEEATFGVRYSMDFHFSDRDSAIREHNKKECYKVSFNSSADRWQIVRNDDYLKRICSYE
ncbi:MAG: caspase family protein [bacterium]